MPLTMCFIVVDSPSSVMDWGFNLCIYDSIRYDITVAYIDSYWCSIYQFSIQKMNN